MSRYVWRDGRWIDPATNLPMLNQADLAMPPAAPMVMRSSFEAYRSMVTGQIVDGQRARREEIAAAKDKNLVPFERVDGRPAGLINEAFAKRGGRRTSEAAKEWAANRRKATAVKLDAKGAILSE